MMQISETEAFRACRVLFGHDLRLNQTFLDYLQPSGAHSAFRKKAKTTHPDTVRHTTHENHRQVRLFQDLNQAHQLVQDYLRQRDLLLARTRIVPAAKKTKPTSAAKRSSHTKPKQGPLPTRPLQFGLYLYHRGLISFKTLAGALVWQRQQRPTIGQIAQRWGWLKNQQVGEILACRRLGHFGERAVHLDLLSSIQVRAILLHQRTRQKKLGTYFIEQGLLTDRQISRLLRELSEHNLKYRHGYTQHYYYHR